MFQRNNINVIVRACMLLWSTLNFRYTYAKISMFMIMYLQIISDYKQKK